MQVNDTRALCPAAQEELRRRVVAHLLGSQARNISQAARTFHVSRTSVHAWLADYQRDGEAGLTSGKPGRPREARLTKAQTAKTTLSLVRGALRCRLGVPTSRLFRKQTSNSVSRSKIRLSNPRRCAT